jgi:hypothetical protein
VATTPPKEPETHQPAPPEPPKVEPYLNIFYVEGNTLRRFDPDRRA